MTNVWLGLETTTATGGIALVSGENLIAEEYFSVMAQHSEQILPSIEALLDKTGIEKDDLAGIAVSTGPGSYTGVRIGLATASGLAAGLEVNLKGVQTLRALAFSVNSSKPVLACIRARDEEVFACLYNDSSPGSSELITPGVYTSACIQRELADYDDITAVGSGRSEFSPSSAITWVPPLWDSPRPSIIAVIGIHQTEISGPDKTISPAYLRGFNEKARDIVS